MSGLGSETDATAVLRAELPDLLRRLGVGTLLDAPCGDGGWIASADLGVRVFGVDVVPGLIAALQRRGDIDRDYLLADITRDPLPAADAILCRDCLVHFSFANIARAVENFRRSGATWLIATTFPDWQTNTDCEDGDWRALNFVRAPFGWGAPAARRSCARSRMRSSCRSASASACSSHSSASATRHHGQRPRRRASASATLTLGPPLVALGGLLVAVDPDRAGVPGAILFGILAATVLGLIFGVLEGPSKIAEFPGSSDFSTIGDALKPSNLPTRSRGRSSR